MKKKLVLLFMAGLAVLCWLSFQMSNIAGNDEEYKRITLSQQSYTSKTIAAERGEIWDRNGTILAGNERVYNLILDPKAMLNGDREYTDTTVTALVECYGYNREDIEKILDDQPESQYVRYVRQMSEEEKQKWDTYEEEFLEKQEEENIERRKNGQSTVNQKLVGVWFEEEYRRVYPFDDLASNVIGFSSSDGRSGRMGLEAYYNDQLTGRDGREYGYFNDDSTAERIIEPARNGYTLITSLDAYVQQVCQKYIDRYNEEVGSKNIGVIVMNPQNAEVIAMAMDNSYNLNDPSDMSKYYTEEELAAMTEEEKTTAMNEMWKNHCISDTFEPGSTAKTFTIASALEEAKITGNEYYYCGGYLTVGGYDIHCHNHSGHGSISVTQTLMSSCNVGLMQIAMTLGAEDFCRYQKIFGFGQATGIDLPDEATAEGLLYQAEDMGAADLATNSFGQNFNTTMIQMAAAYCSILNGGDYYEPRLVRQIIDENGAVVYDPGRTLVRRTVSSETAEFMKNALFQTVEAGTGQKAAMPGYTMGGKTGTAQKLPRSLDTYVVSFVADVPADYPEVFIYVAIDEPQVEKQSDSSQATEMCRNILNEILPYLNIYPTREVAEEETSEDTGDDTGESGDTGETGEGTVSGNSPVIDDNEIYEDGGFMEGGSGGEDAPGEEGEGGE